MAFTLAALPNYTGRHTWSPYGLPKESPDVYHLPTKVWPTGTSWLQFKWLFIDFNCNLWKLKH